MHDLGRGSRAHDDEQASGESGSDEMNDRGEGEHTTGQSKTGRDHHTFPADEDISSDDDSENANPEIAMDGSRIVAGKGTASAQTPKRTKNHNKQSKQSTSTSSTRKSGTSGNTGGGHASGGGKSDRTSARTNAARPPAAAQRAEAPGVDQE